MSRLATIALALALPACGVKQATHQKALDRIAALEGRLAQAEGRIAELETAPAPTAEPAAAAESGEPSLDGAIVVEAERALVGDVDALLGGARIVPSIKAGVPNGLKVYAIRPSSALARLGLANGDMIHAINTHDVTDQDQARKVLELVRDERLWFVEITRRGTPLMLIVQIH